MNERDSMQLTDGQPLERFVQETDEQVFAELVRRHSSLVMSPCAFLRPFHLYALCEIFELLRW